jgi:hypothetical protein
MPRIAKEADPIAMCFKCHAKPAGHGDYYRHSAYCYNCQPMPDFFYGTAQMREADDLFNRAYPNL